MLEFQNGFIEQSIKKESDVLIKVGLDILHNFHKRLTIGPNGTFSSDRRVFLSIIIVNVMLNLILLNEKVAVLIDDYIQVNKLK